MSCVQTIINYPDGMFCFSFQATTPQLAVSFTDKKRLRSMVKLTHFYVGLKDWGWESHPASRDTLMPKTGTGRKQSVLGLSWNSCGQSGEKQIQ